MDIQDLKELIETRFKHVDDKQELIIQQTTKTNGRVTKLEDRWVLTLIGLSGGMLALLGGLLLNKL